MSKSFKYITRSERETANKLGVAVLVEAQTIIEGRLGRYIETAIFEIVYQQLPAFIAQSNNQSSEVEPLKTLGVYLVIGEHRMSVWQLWTERVPANQSDALRLGMEGLEAYHEKRPYEDRFRAHFA